MKSKKEQYKSILTNYLPEEYIEYVVTLLIAYPVKFKIVKPRKTKLGDFRAGIKKEKHQITVNGNLNHYSFLITTLHEFAHLIAFERFGFRISPHGKEWQQTFIELLTPIVDTGHLPKDIETAVLNSMIRVKASSCTDIQLQRTLMRYDSHEEEVLTLESLDKNSIFALNGKSFSKGNLRRTRYLCKDITSNREYLVHALAKVKKIEDEE